MDRRPAHSAVTRLRGGLRRIAPGVLVAVVIAIAAQFLADRYGAPAMLMALLLGIAFHFMAEEGRAVDGIGFTATRVLRIGVALLGARISVELLLALGAEMIALVIAGVILTMLFALVGAWLLGRGWRLGLLTGGAVAICGASAAMAIAAVLPKNEHSERNLIFTVLGVTVLSTMAMIAYPVVAEFPGLDEEAAGVFLGGTIHDVAQVIGAGFSVSDRAGETATMVKLIRVSMLGPVVLVLALTTRAATVPENGAGSRPPLIPGFVLGFVGFATLNSLGLIPEPVGDLLSSISRWALLAAIAAVGMKTSLRRILDVGGQAIALIVAETLFIAGFILSGILYFA